MRSDMLGIAFSSSDSLLSSLLSISEETAAIASRLAGRTRQESLRIFLQERAASYVRAAVELRDYGGATAIVEDARDLTLPASDGELDCIETAWEAIECSTLIYFRDALDLDHQQDLHATLRRWIEDGVSALERLRLPQPAYRVEQETAPCLTRANSPHFPAPLRTDDHGIASF
jgi:hypothetical protein